MFCEIGRSPDLYFKSEGGGSSCFDPKIRGSVYITDIFPEILTIPLVINYEHSLRSFWHQKRIQSVEHAERVNLKCPPPGMYPVDTVKALFLHCVEARPVFGI